MYVSYDVRGLNALPDGIRLRVLDKPCSVGTVLNFEERRGSLARCLAFHYNTRTSIISTMKLVDLSLNYKCNVVV